MDWDGSSLFQVVISCIYTFNGLNLLLIPGRKKFQPYIPLHWATSNWMILQVKNQQKRKEKATKLLFPCIISLTYNLAICRMKKVWHGEEKEWEKMSFKV